MCTPECIIAILGCPVFNEAAKAVIKAGKYARQYRMYMDNLRTELRLLERARVNIDRRVREARDRGEEILNGVTQWQAEASVMENDVQELSRQVQAEAGVMENDVQELSRQVQGEAGVMENDVQEVEARMHCFACSCPNIKLRYHLGKQAEEKIRVVQRLVEDSHFEEISHPKPPPPELEFPSAENYVHLDSRTPIFEQIVVALKDPNVKMIGVHGLGGVGKTTLVEKVARKMLDDGTFKQIPLAAVSSVLNVMEIQKKLAGNLNFRLGAPTDEKANQRQLWHKFRNGDNYLVILDDIWEVVNLIAIGIPITDGKIGCKVVLTSRNKDLLEIRMKTDRNFPIAELEEGEAWELFKKQVGNSMESQPEMESLARKVCKKCKGLPVAIKALGAALECKPIHAWRTALVKLEKYMLTNIDGIDSSVLATLRASYDMLVSPDAKSCFLLCCLFPEDFEISIDELTRLCMVRSLLFQKPHTLEEARDATRSAVDILISTYLLSNGSNENVVRIHDVIRDVGISIAREEQAFLVQHGAPQWPQNLVNEPSYSAISLSSAKIKRLPDDLVYPQLHTLMFDNSELSDLQVPDNFFDGMKQLTVLILTRMRMRRLPSSVAKLSNLRMLCLNQCELADIAVLGDLKTNLEVLSLRGSDITALPLEMAQLTSLRVLDLRDCGDLKLIPQGIISNLTNLEELYFANTFDYWEEIRLLLNIGHLTTLHIHIPIVTLLPKEDLMLENLERFRISVGSNFEWYENFPGTRVLKYEESSLRKEFLHLVDKAEALSLIGIKGLKEVLDYRGVGNGFPNLRYLEVKSCDDDLEYFLGKPKSSVQSHRLHPLQSFNKLNRLVIEKCELRYLFTPTAARGLVHLEQLTVSSCEIMEAIVGFEGQNNENELIGDMMFSKLKKLLLRDLPNLISFYAEKEKTQTTTGSSSAHPQPLFSNKVIFPVLETLHIGEVGNVIEIWDKQSIGLFEAQESFCQLMNLQVWHCNKLMHLFPSKLQLLKNLKKLQVSGCKTMEGVVGFEEELDEDGLRNEQVCFSKLTSLRLYYLPKLVSFCTKMGEAGTTKGNPTIHAQPTLFNGKVTFPALEELIISGVDNIIEIWDKQSITVGFETQGSFCQLMKVNVWGCNKLTHLFPSKMHPLLKNLKELQVHECGTMEGVVGFEGEVDEDGLRNEQVCFSKLTSLNLDHLPKLISFCTKMGEAGTTEGNPTIHAQPLFNGKVAFPALEGIYIYRVPMITGIWVQQPLSKSEKEVESFCKLKSIQVWFCDQLEYVLPSYMLPQLHSLLELRIHSCNELEVIVSNKLKEKEATNNDILVFPQLKTLTLRFLENLKCFCTGTDQLLFSHKVAFPALEDLKISCLSDITEIWDKKLVPEPEKEIESFRKLARIEIFRCDQLVYVLPSYMLPRLQNLQKLDIQYCKEVEVIVTKELKEKEVAENDPIVFSQLKDVVFNGLPLCSLFFFPLCSLFFSNKVAFPALEHLTITKMPKIKEIWDKQPLPEPEKKPKSFYKLMSIHVEECDHLVYVFPSYMLPQLQNLEKLVIANCKEMEVIISNKLKEKEVTNNDIILFAELKTVILQNLPNLKRLCAEMQLAFSNKDAFPVLEINKIEVAIKYPWELRHLKTSCIAPNLMFLVNGTSTKEESGTSGKDEDSNDHDKEGEDGEEDVKNADDNKGVEGEEKDEDEEEGGGGGGGD